MNVIGGDIAAISRARRLSRATMRNSRQNRLFSCLGPQGHRLVLQGRTTDRQPIGCRKEGMD